MPTYNERDNIESIVRALVARPCRPRVLVVDDSSPDGTAEIVTKLAEELPDRVSLLSRTAKDGLGRAYAAGFALALADFNPDAVVQMDADGSHDPADVDRLVAALDHADLALSSRYMPGGDVVGWSKHREWLSRAGNLYARTLLGHLTVGSDRRVQSLARRVACQGPRRDHRKSRVWLSDRDDHPSAGGRREDRGGPDRVPRAGSRYVEDVRADRHRGVARRTRHAAPPSLGQTIGGRPNRVSRQAVRQRIGRRGPQSVRNPSRNPRSAAAVSPPRTDRISVAVTQTTR